MTPWLTVVGIGDDGLAGLTSAARALVADAELLVGGERHQAMVSTTPAKRLTWQGGLDAVMDDLEHWRGRRVVVLATGDPMCFGAGANLLRRFSADDMMVVPVPGAFSLAAARMLWSLPDTETVTVHGRPLETLLAVVAPGVRILALSRDGETPGATAALLARHGYGPSRLTVLEHLGGPRERRIDGTAEAWSAPRTADLNTMAIECRAASGCRPLSRAPGLPDEAFENDGQLTKREVRAATVAALEPLPGQVLWDVGAGAGSIAIEWLRAVSPRRTAAGVEARAIAVERNRDRCATIARNAGALGVPQLRVVEGEAPAVLASLSPSPDSVFVGGGVHGPGLMEACRNALAPGGRMVANAVTVEGIARLMEVRRRFGGELTRIAVARVRPVGDLNALAPLMEVVQYVGTKP